MWCNPCQIDKGGVALLKFFVNGAAAGLPGAA